MNHHICPICGFASLEQAAYSLEGDESFEMCPSCGCEFGYDDSGKTHRELRKAWIERAVPWSSSSPAPENWDAERQLKNLASLAMEQAWILIESLLQNAWKKVSKLSQGGDLPETSIEFSEFMKEGEYELAWDALAQLAESQESPPTFWMRMADAAALMGLTRHENFALGKIPKVH